MPSYRLTPRARLGLATVLAHVESRFGARLAERVLDQLEGACEMLARRPGLGRVREDLAAPENVRFWSVGPTLIAYRQVADVVEILFVERAARDFDALLGGDA